MQFGLVLEGERAVTLRLEKFTADVHARLLETMRSLEQRLEAAVIAAEPNLTGALRAITGGRVYEHDTRIAAVVGVRAQGTQEAGKASALEYGSKGTAFAVRAHHATLWHVYARAIAPMTVEVADHTRIGTIDPRRFLRSAVDGLKTTAIAEMRRALDQAVSSNP